MCIPFFLSLEDGNVLVEDIHVQIGWVQESLVLVQARDSLHVFFSQIKVVDGKILSKSFIFRALRDDLNASLHGPAQQYLGWRLAVLATDGLHDLILKRTLLDLGHLQLHVGQGTKTAVSGYGDSFVLAEANEQRLCMVRVNLDLQGSRLDLGVGPEVANKGSTHVRDADVLHKAFVDELLHGGPGLGEGRRIFNDAAFLVVVVAGRVPRLKRYKFEREREVD